VAAKSLLSRATAFGETIRHLGWLNAGLYAAGRVAEIVSRGRIRLHKYYFVAQPVRKTPWLPGHRGQAFRILRVAESDPMVSTFPRPEWAAPYRFKQGAVCLAALKADAFAGFLWLSLGAYQEDEVRCRYVLLPPGRSAWDFDVHIEPEHRSSVAFLKLWDEANRFLTSRRIEWSLSRISAFNSGSIMSHARMGAARIGSAAFLAIGTWQIAVSTVPPRLHFSVRAGSFPIYALGPGRSP
jgi:hypothetical protein